MSALKGGIQMKRTLCLVVFISVITLYGNVAKPQSFCLQDPMGSDCGSNKAHNISEITFVLNRLEAAVYDDFLVHFDVKGSVKTPIFIGWRYRKEFTAKIVTNKVFQNFGNLYVNMNKVKSISLNKTSGKISFKHYDVTVKDSDLVELRKFAKKQGVSGGKIKGLAKFATKKAASSETIMVKR